MLNGGKDTALLLRPALPSLSSVCNMIHRIRVLFHPSRHQACRHSSGSNALSARDVQCMSSGLCVRSLSSRGLLEASVCALTASSLDPDLTPCTCQTSIGPLRSPPARVCATRESPVPGRLGGRQASVFPKFFLARLLKICASLHSFYRYLCSLLAQVNTLHRSLRTLYAVRAAMPSDKQEPTPVNQTLFQGESQGFPSSSRAALLCGRTAMTDARYAMP